MNNADSFQKNDRIREHPPREMDPRSRASERLIAASVDKTRGQRAGRIKMDGRTEKFL